MSQLDANIFALLLGAALLVVAVLSSVLATRFGAPLLFLFLLIGMLAGEDGPGGLVFQNFTVVHLIGSAALALILFDGGLRTKASAFRRILAPAGLLATLGVMITALVVAGAAVILLGFSFLEAFLLGAAVAPTDAAAMFFIVKAGGLRMKRRVGDTLEIESVANDPISIVLVFALIGVVSSGTGDAGSAALIFAKELLIGAVMGGLGGLVVSVILQRVPLPGGLHPVFASAAALLVFAETQWLGGSGFLAVYVAGLVVGNRPMPAGSSILAFTDAATWVAQIIMFMLLGLLAAPHRLPALLLPALGIAAVLMLVARPLAVVACLAPLGFKWMDQAFIAWLGLRGAVAIFLATLPAIVGLPHGLEYFDVAFFVVLVSLLVQGWTVRPAATLFGVALPGADHPESRTELDLPGQSAQELVGYPIRAEARFLRHARLPGWATLVLVARGDAVLLPADAGDIAVGDYLYILAPHARVPLLDRLFSETEGERTQSEIYFGEFVVAGTTPMAEILHLYAEGATCEERTVAEAFAHEFGTPVVGDVVSIGSIDMVAKVVDNDHVTEAGLRLEPEKVKHRLRRLARKLVARRAA